MVAAHLTVCSVNVRPFVSSPSPRLGLRYVRPVRKPVNAEEKAQTPSDVADDNLGTVLPGLRNWPPKPFTEHGEPNPEDDPANYSGQARVKGPSEEEVTEKRNKLREESPFSNPDREGGTQQGGGGEGSSA
eukprot:jgi/Botrbrau1/5732/Bobra.0134s0008.1